MQHLHAPLLTLPTHLTKQKGQCVIGFLRANNNVFNFQHRAVYWPPPPDKRSKLIEVKRHLCMLIIVLLLLFYR